MKGMIDGGWFVEGLGVVGGMFVWLCVGGWVVVVEVWLGWLGGGESGLLGGEGLRWFSVGRWEKRGDVCFEVGGDGLGAHCEMYVWRFLGVGRWFGRVEFLGELVNLYLWFWGWMLSGCGGAWLGGLGLVDDFVGG